MTEQPRHAARFLKLRSRWQTERSGRRKNVKQKSEGRQKSKTSAWQNSRSCLEKGNDRRMKKEPAHWQKLPRQKMKTCVIQMVLALDDRPLAEDRIHLLSRKVGERVARGLSRDLLRGLTLSLMIRLHVPMTL